MTHSAGTDAIGSASHPRLSTKRIFANRQETFS